MRRRTFLEVALLCASLLASFGAWARKSGRKGPARLAMVSPTAADVVIDQSGKFGSDEHAFAIGALSCEDYAGGAAAIQQLRVKTRFRCRFSYSSRNKWKAEYATRLIDFWIDRSKIRIDVILIPGSKRFAREKPIERLSRYTESVSMLVDVAAGKNDACRLVTQTHFTKDPQRRFEEMLKLRNKRVAQVLHARESQSEFLQLLDFVVGTVAQVRRERNRVFDDNKMKDDLAAYLAHKVGATSMAAPLRHPKLTIRVV